jgi:hypothetical protein
LPARGVVRRTRPDAVRTMSRGAACRNEPPTEARSNTNALHSEWRHSDPAGRIGGGRHLLDPCAKICRVVYDPG